MSMNFEFDSPPTPIPASIPQVQLKLNGVIFTLQFHPLLLHFSVSQPAAFLPGPLQDFHEPLFWENLNDFGKSNKILNLIKPDA